MKFRKIDTVKLYESGLSRILQHVKDKNTFAVIGTQDKDTRKSRYFDLIHEIGKLKNYDKPVGFNRLEGTYTYDGEDTPVHEDSLIIYNITKEDALKLAKKLNQESIIWKDDNYFGFLTQDGKEDGELGRGLSFDEESVKAFGSRLVGKHNNAKPFIFSETFYTNDVIGSNFSKQNKAKEFRDKIFTYTYRP